MLERPLWWAAYSELVTGLNHLTLILLWQALHVTSSLASVLRSGTVHLADFANTVWCLSRGNFACRCKQNNAAITRADSLVQRPWYVRRICMRLHVCCMGVIRPSDLLSPNRHVSTVSASCFYWLRQRFSGNLVVPRTRRRIGDRAFSLAAPRAWNKLPTELKLLRSTDLFRRDL